MRNKGELIYLFFYVNIKGIQQILLAKAIYNKYICQKEKKYITISTVKLFIETSAKHLQLLG